MFKKVVVLCFVAFSFAVMAQESQVGNNYVGIPVVVTDEDGEEIKGEGTIIFEADENSGIKSLDKPGSLISVKTVNKKGRFKKVIFKAKKLVSFCIEGTDVCYQGFGTKGLALGNTYLFRKLVVKKGKLGIYESATGIDNFFLWKEGENTAIRLRPVSLLGEKDIRDKTFAKLYDYLAECPAVKQEINKDNTDLENLKDLERILDVYNTNCN